MVLRSIGRWKRDADVDDCEGCQSAFTFFRRRHHCRQCGGVFCAKCSDNALLIPLIDKEKEQKVCDICFNQKLTAERRLREQRSAAPKSETAVERALERVSAARAAPKETTTAPPSAAAAAPEDVGEVVTVEGQHSHKQEQEHPHHPHYAYNSADTEQYQQPEATSQPPQVDGYRETASGGSYADEDSDGDFDGPDVSAMVSANAFVSSRHNGSHQVSTRNLSFLSRLQDSVRQWDANNVMNILMFAGPERQQPMVITVEPHETMGDIASRLGELYFRLSNPPFTKATPEAVALLRDALRFTSEYQEIDLLAKAMDVVVHSRNVVLSSIPPEQLAEVLNRNVESGRSVRDFLRSERSENVEDEDF